MDYTLQNKRQYLKAKNGSSSSLSKIKSTSIDSYIKISNFKAVYTLV